jgi:uncharacterized protein
MATEERVVTDNLELSRYELETPAGTAVLAYRRRGDRIELVHTEVPTAAEGRGYGASLARHALDAARAAGARVVPSCSYVAAYVQRHPEYQDLLAD